VTISVKVPIELKEKIKKLGIKPSNLLRKAIEEEVRSKEVERIKREIEELKPLLSKISIEDATKSIREDREQR
jgi:post-segregation antitoxin (ccd killing protein)